MLTEIARWIWMHRSIINGFRFNSQICLSWDFELWRSAAYYILFVIPHCRKLCLLHWYTMFKC